jgi:hypothetical protein
LAIACSLLSICPETGFANYELQKRVDTSSSFGKFLQRWWQRPCKLSHALSLFLCSLHQPRR